MKSILLICFFFVTAPLMAQPRNILGLDLGGYVVLTPKYNLPGNEYHPYVDKNTGGQYGITCERLLGQRHGVKTGFYVNEQFKSLLTFYVPIDYNYCFWQHRLRKYSFGGTAGINLNFLHSNTGNLFSDLYIQQIIYRDLALDFDVGIKKKFYVAPHAGLWGGMRFGRFGLLMQFLCHYPIPQFVQFTTSYNAPDGSRITEMNTNRQFGVSINFGIQIWIGRLEEGSRD